MYMDIHTHIYTHLKSQAYGTVAKDDFLTKGFWRRVDPNGQIQSPAVI